MPQQALPILLSNQDNIQRPSQRLPDLYRGNFECHLVDTSVFQQT